MLDLIKTKQELEDFGKYIVQQARTNLTKGIGKKKKGSYNVNKRLYDSIIFYPIEETEKGLRIRFDMEDYGMFLDRGVRGKKGGKSLSGFSFKSKMPPREPIFEWAKKRRIKLRDEKGQFKKGWGTYKSIAFLIQRSIFRKGIKPSLFFTKPFYRAFDRLPKELAQALVNDLITL